MMVLFPYPTRSANPVLSSFSTRSPEAVLSVVTTRSSHVVLFIISTRSCEMVLSDLMAGALAYWHSPFFRLVLRHRCSQLFRLGGGGSFIQHGALAWIDSF